MSLLIVTGMSGAGKSQAANALEDIGYYCVDNIPPSIIPVFVDLAKHNNSAMRNLAIITDVRGGELFSDVYRILGEIKEQISDYKILFLDAADDVLVRRYKENRRKHPLCDNSNMSVAAAVKKERKILEKLRFKADYIVDTSYLSVAQLKVRLSDVFFGNDNNGFSIQCMSFGFKYGPATEADLMIDVRCLPNPFYVPELKNRTGLEKKVQDYVLCGEESKDYAEKLLEFIDCSIPLYEKEGKTQLVIAFGCTGGKHRSVTFAELIKDHLEEKGYSASAVHRDIQK